MTPEDLVEAWDRGDPALESGEKETTIRWAKPDAEAVVHTDEAGVGRRVIVHPESTVEAVNVLRGETYERLAPEDVGEDDEVVGVTCRLPVAAVLIKSRARTNAQHAAAVSDAVLEP